MKLESMFLATTSMSTSHTNYALKAPSGYFSLTSKRSNVMNDIVYVVIRTHTHKKRKSNSCALLALPGNER